MPASGKISVVCGKSTRSIRRRDFIKGGLLVPLAGFTSGFAGAASVLAGALTPDPRNRRGPLIVTEPVTPPEEPCWIGPLLDPASPGGFLTRDYFVAPAAFLGNPSATMDENFGRMSQLVRENARLHDPKRILANAVRHSLGSDSHVAVPLAQLAVTGAASFDKFSQWTPTDADLLQYLSQSAPDLAANSEATKSAVSFVLDATYAALWAIRANDPRWRAYRRRLGWMGASGEDDLPHRPVNIPSAPFPQFSLPLEVNGQRVVGRYLIASSGAEYAANAEPAQPS
ncbi:MAG TPA: hypothetical protein VMT58_04130, partial [Candidatus Binataceae bacterium]|nr:hypothetical protein [Candidatus Binataceae bacterium]